MSPGPSWCSISGSSKASSPNTGSTWNISALGGDAKVQQALTAKSVDFGLGSGPSMAFVAKGAPVFAVAAFAAEPRNIAVVVGANSPIKTVADLKGKTLAVTTAGSLTDWLAHRLAVQEGWGTDGVKTRRARRLHPSARSAQDRADRRHHGGDRGRLRARGEAAKAKSSSAWRNTRRNSSPMWSMRAKT